MTNFSGRIQDMTWLIDVKPIQDKKFSGALPFFFENGNFVEYKALPEVRNIEAEVNKLSAELEKAKTNLSRSQQQHDSAFTDRQYSRAESFAMSCRRHEKEVARLTGMIDGLKNNEASILAGQIQSMRDYISNVERDVIGPVKDQLQSIESRLNEISKPAKKAATA